MGLNEKLKENYPEYIEGIPVGEIIRSITGIDYGYVHIIIQDSKVIQIEKTEKKRITNKPESDYLI